MINVHHSRGLSTCTHQLLANRASARCVTGVKGGRAAPEAATVQECCGRRASPPSCDLLGTLHEPKGRGEACGFVLVFFTSPPRILYCFSGKLLSASAGVLFVAQPVLFAKKKKRIPVLPWISRWTFSVEYSLSHVLWEGKKWTAEPLSVVSQEHQMNCLQLCSASNAVREAISRRRQVPLTGVGHQGAKGCTGEHESSSWPEPNPAPELGNEQNVEVQRELALSSGKRRPWL